jgi:hypothetical protein
MMRAELRGYLEAILFSECAWWKALPDASEAPSLDKLYSVADFAPAFVAESSTLVDSFLQANSEALEAAALEPSTVGACLWWSRNGHGTGFWDRVRPSGLEAVASWKLHDAAKALGSCDVSPDMFSAGDQGRRVRAVIVVSFFADSLEAEEAALDILDGTAAHLDAELRDSGHVSEPSVWLGDVIGGYTSSGPT